MLFKEHLQIQVAALLESISVYLNQPHTWFLQIDPVRIVGMCVCVCVSAPEAINN